MKNVLSNIANGVLKASVDGTTNEIQNVADGTKPNSVATVNQVNNGTAGTLRKVKVTLDMNTTDPQPIALVGGTLFDVVDIRPCNVQPSKITTAADLEFYDDLGQDSQILAGTSDVGYTPPDLLYYIPVSNLETASLRDLFVEKKSANPTIAYLNAFVGNTIYAFLGTPEGSAKTIDCYVYYYVIE